MRYSRYICKLGGDGGYEKMNNRIMAEKSDKQNIQSIQLLRGIAALGVVLSHSAALYLPRTNFFQPVSAFGSVGVYIFFIISGFIIPYAMLQNKYEISHFKNLMLRRIMRIEPPYIICIILILLLDYLSYFSPWYTGARQVAPINWGNVLGHIGYINAFTHKPWLSPVFWTLAIEFEYYILIGLTFPLITSNNKKIALLTHVLLLGSTYLIPHIYAGDEFHIHYSHIISFIPFFLMGTALFLKRARKLTTIEFGLMIVLDAAVCLQHFGINILAVCILSLLSIQFIKRVPKIFLWLGTISYSLYLTHSLVIARFMVLSGKVTKDKFSEFRIMLCIMACIAAGYIYYLLFEKRFVNLSKRVSQK